jgi:hypothetical protein
MSNTLTALAPTLFDVLGEIAAEPAGVLDAVDFRTSGLSVNSDNSVTIPVAPTASVSTYSPAMTTTAGTDKTASSVTISFTANQESSFNLTGEDIRSLENGDGNRIEWVRQCTGQSMRALRNAAAAACALAIKKGGSRAVGTAGTTPFASDLSALTAARKVLRDNGAPLVDLQCVVDSSSYLNLTNLGIFQQAQIAGSDAERRDGIARRQFGFQIREEGNIAAHTKGAGTGYDIVGAGEAVGQTTLSLEAGTVNTTGIADGDIVTFSGGTSDTNKYCVNTGLQATSGNIVIGNPGLRVVKVDADELTIGDSYSPNFAFERMAVVGFARAPIIPNNANIRQLPITDPKSGLTFLLCEIAGDGMVTWRLHLAYGFKVIRSEFVVPILG